MSTHAFALDKWMLHVGTDSWHFMQAQAFKAGQALGHGVQKQLTWAHWCSCCASCRSGGSCAAPAVS